MKQYEVAMNVNCDICRCRSEAAGTQSLLAVGWVRLYCLRRRYAPGCYTLTILSATGETVPKLSGTKFGFGVYITYVSKHCDPSTKYLRGACHLAPISPNKSEFSRQFRVSYKETLILT